VVKEFPSGLVYPKYDQLFRVNDSIAGGGCGKSDMLMKKPLLLVKAGGTIPETLDERGDFENWFAEALGYPDMHQVDVFRDAC
jgi:hypothetical protein